MVKTGLPLHYRGYDEMTSCHLCARENHYHASPAYDSDDHYCE